MTAEHETFHTVSGDTEKVPVGVRAPDQRPECDCGACAPSVGKPEHQLEHQIPSFRAAIRPVPVQQSEAVRRSWNERVHDTAMHQPINQMTLHRLRALEAEIRSDAAPLREETREHVEAIALVCAYKLRIMQSIEDAREDARDRAQREGRVRYVD